MATLQDAYNQSLLKKYQKKQAIVEDASVPANTTKKGYQFGDVTGTLLDITGDVLKGAAQSLEGIVDAGAGIYGKISGKEEKMTKFINKDLAFTKAVNDLDAAMSQATLLGDNKVSNIVHGVGEGVGGMLPSIAVSFIPVAGQALGMATFGIGAAGSGVQEALRDGATYNQALGYGALTGGTEVAVEYASAGLGKALGGSFGKTMPQIAKFGEKGIKGVAKTFVEEGTEEVASDLINPLWKKLTYKKGEKLDIPSLEDLTNTFIIGGATGVALGGAGKITNNLINGKDGAKYRKLQAEANELKSEIDKNELKGLDEETKAKAIEQLNGKLNEIDELGKKIIQDGKKSFNTLKKNGDIALDIKTGEYKLTDKFQRSLDNSTMGIAQKIMDTNNKITGNNVQLKTVDEYNGKLNTEKGTTINAFYDEKTNTVYLNPKTAKPLAMAIAHELGHGAEGTNMYENLKTKILSNLDVEAERAKLRDVSVYKNLSDAKLDAEIVTHQIEQLFNGKNKSLYNLLAQDYSLRAKITSWLNKVKNRLKMGSEEYNQYEELVEDYKSALKEAGDEAKRKAKRDETFAKVTVKGKELAPATSYSASEGKTKKATKSNDKELVALHNLDERKLSNVLELGGFAMPSIAITKSSIPHVDYGDITVVFNKDTIDPKNYDNEVYDRDVWSPTTPSVDVELNKTKVENFEDEIENKVKDYPFLKYKVDSFLTNRYKNNNGDYVVGQSEFSKDKLLRDALYNEAIGAAFLLDNKIDLPIDYRESTFKINTWYNKDIPYSEIKKLIDKWNINEENYEQIDDESKYEKDLENLYKKIELDKAIASAENSKRIRLRKANTQEAIEAVNDIYNDDIKKAKEEIDEIVFSKHETNVKGIVKQFFNRNENSVDIYKTKDSIRELIENKYKDKFDNWVWEKIKGFENKKGIRNDKDFYSPSGNPRSFNILHDTYNLNNIVYAMKKESKLGNAGLFGVSDGALSGKLARQFTSIDDIKEARNMLKNINDDEYSEWKEKRQELWTELVSEIANNSNKDLIDSMSRMEDVSNILAECAEVRPLAVENILSKFNKETKGYNFNYKFDTKMADKVLTYFQSLRNVPTRYFEAKPRRAVGLNEIAKVIIPNTTSQTLIDQLKEKNIPYEIYDSKDENARTKIVDSMEEVKFSATQDLATARAENKRLREENKFTKEANERLSDYAANIVSEANEQIVREKAYNKNVNKIVKTAQFFKQNYATKQAIGIDSDIPQNLVDMAKLLGKLENRADVNRKNARDIIKLYKERYYNDDNITLDGMLDDQIKQQIDLVINGKGRLTLEDVRALNNILGNARHLIQDFNTVRIGNRNANLDNLIVDGADYIKNSQVAVKNTRIGNYLLTMAKPRTFFEKLDGYNPNGTMTKLYQNIQDGETKKYVAYMTMAKPVDEFFKDHKGYETSLREEIDMGGWKITKGQAMYVAMLVERPQAEYHLRYGGLDVLDKKGVATNHPITRTEIKTINDSLTDNDKEFMKLVKDIFNGQAKDYKVETDMALNGFTNIEEGDNYIPIKTAKSSIRKSLGDTRSFYKELATTVNETFNKETKQNAKNPIKNTNLLDVLVEHIDNVSTYYGLAMPFKTFDLVFNRTVDGYSIREALARKHDLSLTMNYIGDLFADIQGIGNKRQGFDAIISKVRGHYARAVLGLNLKVGLNQTTSYVAAMYLLSPSALSKGLGMKANFDTMFEYCPYAEWRYYNKDMIKAQSLTDSNNLTASKVDKALDKLMFMTTGFDKLTIGKLWNATQVWVEETTGNKIGTEENLKEAGKKLEEVIRLTQPNYNASERPAILRSKSELVRGFVMFMTQPLQNFNILQEGIGKYKALSKMTQTPEIAKAMKQAKTDAIRGAIGVTLETAMYVAITTLFKKLLRKKKDDESWGETIAKDFGSSIFGMFPFVRDFYSYMTDGFDIDNVTDSMLNTIAGAVKKGATAIGKMIQGEIQTEQELAKTQRDMTFAITQFAGIPYKNVKNLIEGIAGNIDPTIAYKIDTRYSSSTTYKEDLDKAISKNNNRLADTIISQTLNRKNIAYNKELVKFLREMYKKGYNLMPKQVGKSFTHNGETIELKRVNQQRFINVYAQSEDSILNILQNKQFIKLSDDAKAKAVNNIYDYYYNLAKEDLGLSVDTKSYLLGKTTNVGNLSLILAEISQFSGSGRKEQVFNYLNRQKLSAAEKYLIMGYLGYKNTKGQNQVKAFLNGKNLTQEQKSILYNMTFGEQ